MRRSPGAALHVRLPAAARSAGSYHPARQQSRPRQPGSGRTRRGRLAPPPPPPPPTGASGVGGAAATGTAAIVNVASGSRSINSAEIQLSAFSPDSRRAATSRFRCAPQSPVLRFARLADGVAWVPGPPRRLTDRAVDDARDADSRNRRRRLRRRRRGGDGQPRASTPGVRSRRLLLRRNPYRRRFNPNRPIGVDGAANTQPAPVPPLAPTTCSASPASHSRGLRPGCPARRAARSTPSAPLPAPLSVPGHLLHPHFRRPACLCRAAAAQGDAPACVRQRTPEMGDGGRGRRFCSGCRRFGFEFAQYQAQWAQSTLPTSTTPGASRRAPSHLKYPIVYPPKAFRLPGASVGCG